jgi:hypothetical protein
MMQFREGDVVRLRQEDGTTPSPTGEAIVRGAGEAIVCVEWPDGDEGTWHPRCATLIRRPVRFGDALVSRAQGSVARWRATERDVLDAHNWTSGNVTHDDGTPIDVESKPVVDETDRIIGYTMSRSIGYVSRADLETHLGKPTITAAEGVTPEQIAAAMSNAIQSLGPSVICHRDIRPPWLKPPVDRMRTALRSVAIDGLARALFDTDHRVTLFACKKAESCGWDGTGTWAEFDAARRARHERTLAIAWERDEGGWATEARKRAAAVVDVLRSAEEAAHPMLVAGAGGRGGA